MSLFLIIYNLFSIPFYLLLLFVVKLKLFFSNYSIGIIFGDFSEFIYKCILYPYFFVYSNGFFNYYGNYSVSNSYNGMTTMNLIIGLVDVTDVFNIKKDYMSPQKR